MSASWNSHHGLRPEQLAQRRDLHLQVVLLNHETRSSSSFLVTRLAPFDQRQQDVEGTAPQSNSLAVDK